MIKKYLHSLFYPFDKTFEIVVIGEDKNVCEQFVKMCENFITNNELRQYGLEHSYNTRNNVFEMKIDKQNFIKFRFYSEVLPENKWQKAKTTGDVLVPIFKLDKYHFFENNCSLSPDIDGFLGEVRKNKKTTILALINFDYFCHKPIDGIEKWEELTNKIYDTLRNKKNLNKVINNDINRDGQKILDIIFAVFQQHLRNTEYTAYKICNFFCYNETNGFTFGKQEFFNNLLMRLLTFDKLNNYQFRIK